MIKVSDYVVAALKKQGVTDVFMISGGGAMHLNDSFGRGGVRVWCNHNEQATAMSAEGYARAAGRLAVACVTTGPGGLNCLNGVFGAWTDSVPVLFISGQVKTATTRQSCPQLPLRQLGDQEAPIIDVVKPLTKFAASVTSPLEIEFVLQKALHAALSGRPGPVWVDIPLDVQAALIDPKKLKQFTPPAPRKPAFTAALSRAVKRLQQAKRPLIVAGHGVRLSGRQDSLRKLLGQTQIPVVSTFNGMDLVDSQNPLFAGRIGTVGQRAGNFALQNADAVLFLGTRNNIRQVSYNWENFAKRAVKIVVDIDKAELQKPTVRPDIAVHADLREALPALVKVLQNPLGTDAWRAQIKKWRAQYPPLREFAFSPEEPVHPYLFMQTLGEKLGPCATVAASNGTACVALFQAAGIKEGQRVFFNSGDASMGYGLPAAIGACAALGGKEVVCLEGDGSVMMNLQELQTVKTYGLPVKLFILKNGGYNSIIQTQRNFFEGRLTACEARSGVQTPDFTAVARAFGLPAERIASNKELPAKLAAVLRRKGPVVCEVDCACDYAFAPKLSARKLPDGSMVSPTLEDMFPFLDRAELEENIIK